MRIPRITVGKEHCLAFKTLAPAEDEVAGPEFHIVQHPVYPQIVKGTTAGSFRSVPAGENHQHNHENPGIPGKINSGKGKIRNHRAVSCNYDRTNIKDSPSSAINS